VTRTVLDGESALPCARTRPAANARVNAERVIATPRSCSAFNNATSSLALDGSTTTTRSGS
jgi:hypothetical protein